MSDQSPEEVLCVLTSKRSGFLHLFSSSSSTNDSRLMEALVSALCKACQAVYSPRSLGRLLQTVNESGFLSSPLYQHFVDRGSDVGAPFVTSVVCVVKSLLHHLPSSSLGSVTLLLSRLSLWKQLNGDAESAAAECVRGAEDALRDVTRQIRGGDLLRDQEDPAADVVQPPDDFRQIPTAPTPAEIKSDEAPFLRANIVYGAYRDADHYLDVQYRLLREDFVCPLREGLRTLREYADRNVPAQRVSDVRFYRGVRIATPYCTQTSVIYRARFDVSQFPRVRWESSKRLISGSLVGVSRDSFETIVFGTVAIRSPDSLKKGEVDLQFEDESACLIDPNPYTVYEMVECSAYFEAYRHVLEGLQEIAPDSLPFEKHLLNQTAAAEGVDVPRYLSDRNKTYDFGCLVTAAGRRRSWENVPVLSLGEWPSADALGLDESQYSALQTAVTREFVTIQGPPGTGKTFVGLKIIQLLLANRRHWDADASPILVVCFTNHALDQFLEGIIETCGLAAGELVRVGSRSTSDDEKLAACSLFRIKKDQRIRNEQHVHERIIEAREEMSLYQAEITLLVGQLVFARKSVIHEKYLQEFMTEAQSRSLYSVRNRQVP